MTLTGEECVSLLQTTVRENLLDVEILNDRIDELSIMAGLEETGFDQERILQDLNTLREQEPLDTREWRIGEALAEVILEQEYNARFHWNELRDARNPKGNKTGADLVGFVDTTEGAVFLFGEVKTSSEAATPPAVMTDMERQLRNLWRDNTIRLTLISYLVSKTTTLEPNHPFKTDYSAALRNYYRQDASNFQLAGVLMRDTAPNENDLSGSYRRLNRNISVNSGLKLFAFYSPISTSEWENWVRRPEEI